MEVPFVLFLSTIFLTIQTARVGLLYLDVDPEFHPVALFSVGILFYTSDHVSGTPERKARILELVNKAHVFTCALFIWQFMTEEAQYQTVVRFVIMVVSTISSYIAMKLMQSAQTEQIDD